MADWLFGYLMPGLHLAEPVEFGPVAVVPPTDPRVRSLVANNKGVASLVGRVTNQFDEPISPASLLYRADKPATVDHYALASFRNCLALCSVIDGTVFALGRGSSRYALWSDHFDFYPYTSDAEGNLSSQSIAFGDIHRSGPFKGQSAPHIPPAQSVSFGLDKRTFRHCMRAWSSFFLKGDEKRPNRKLFRSLEVAFQAMRVPAVGSRHSSIHDFGIGVGLWVSAFEVLGRPWGKKKVNLGVIVELLGGAAFFDGKLTARRHRIKYNGKKSQINIVQWLYTRLYAARNDYMHGNAVDGTNLFPDQDTSRPNLLRLAPLVFRAALDSYLPQTARRTGKLAERLADEMLDLRFQSRYEAAILSAKT